MADQVELQLTRHQTIDAYEPSSWDAYFLNNGNLNYDNLKLIEECFSNQSLPENNWDFHYITIKDAKGDVVLQTFFTVALTKDDMLSPAHVSEKVEEQRMNDPYYLTSKNVIAGSMLTKGRQIYINQEHKGWKEAVKMLIATMQEEQKNTEANALLLRDFFGAPDEEFEQFMLEQGFIKQQMLNNCVVENLAWKTSEEFLQGLGQKYRYNVRKEILKFEHQFEVECGQQVFTREEIQNFYRLYEAVFERALALNVFKLPFSYFEEMCNNQSYDILRLYIQPAFSQSGEKELVGVMFSQVNDELYNAMIVGLDYRYVFANNTYKQILYQTLLRAKSIGCTSLDLAYTAELEKKKLGAKLQEVYAFTQASEHFNYSVLETI